MLKKLWPILMLCISGKICAQQDKRPGKEKNKFTDSAAAALLKEDQLYELPIITINETERSESGGIFVPGILSANRDVLASMAAFHFSVTRFRLRGYSADLSGIQINGLHMNNADDGYPQWNVWSGLNEVTRNNRLLSGTASADPGFTNPGSTAMMDMRASKQREQTIVSSAFSNRMFNRRLMFTKSSGINQKGWAYAFSASWRSAGEGYYPGTYQQGGSYYVAVDKQLNSEHLLSLIFLGSSLVNSRQGPVLKESVKLHASSLYNPYWGYQTGKKRNANQSRSHQPLLILTDEYRINNHTTRVSSLGLMAGTKSSTALDWYNAPDPRPDYYRYLPSYQTDSLLRVSVADAITGDPSLLQINWDRLYDVNRNSRETVMDADGVTGNSFTGLRAHYLLSERVMAMKRMEFSTQVITRPDERISLTAGAWLQVQQTNFYTKIKDMLGAEYSVDWNPFAENDQPGNQKTIQNNMNKPNRVLRQGDRYGYDYLVTTSKAEAFATIAVTQQKVDLFAALSVSSTGYYREGKTRNGLFPFDSYGKSKPLSFTNMAIKSGITYKINGRKYVYLQAVLMSKAPLFDNVFVSPRTRDTRQQDIVSEKIISLEAGHIHNSPKLKLRLSAYLFAQNDAMNVLTFYHDAYRSFVNYALSGINKIHYGMEMGGEYKLTGRLTIQAGISSGRYYYNSRQKYSITADNDAFELDRGLVYTQNFRVEGTPQEAYGIGLSYQHNNSYLNLSASYFREHWLAFNPIRRTYPAMENVTEGTEQWHKIIDQEKLPEQYTADLSGGTSFRVKLWSSLHRQTILINISINNLLNKKDILSGGYEQLRFDANTKNVNKFPPKYFYAMGLNYSVNISLRL